MKTIRVRTAAWFSDEERIFEVPDDFEVDYIAPQDAPALSPSQIHQSLDSPFGKSLGEAVAKASKITIVVDDLGRPTPAGDILPMLLDRLFKEGVQRNQVRFLIATGSHRQLTREDMIKKLGKDVVDNFTIDCHDAFKSPLTDLGSLDNGFPVVVNKIAAESDLLIGIGCVIPHACHGFGGGAKLFCPGIAGMASIVSMHGFTPKRGRAIINVPEGAWDMRSASEAFISKLPPIFLINVIVNTRRQIAGMFCGDPQGVFEAAKSFAAGVYKTRIDPHRAALYDVVLLNMYPLDSDPVQSGKSQWIKSYFPRALAIQINSTADGIDYHGWKLLRRSSRIRWVLIMTGRVLNFNFLPPSIRTVAARVVSGLRKMILHAILRRPRVDYGTFMSHLKPVETYRNESLLADDTNPAKQPWIFSENYPANQFKEKYPNGTLLNEWPHVVQAIRRQFKCPRIAVVTSATVQIPEWNDAV